MKRTPGTGTTPDGPLVSAAPGPYPVDREAYFLAAYQLMESSGYGTVTVDGLCAGLHVTKGSFYKHFADFEDFVDGFSQRWVRAACAYLDVLVAAPDIRRRLEVIANGHVYFQTGAERAIRAWAGTRPAIAQNLSRIHRQAQEEGSKVFTEVVGDAQSGALVTAAVIAVHVGLAQCGAALTEERLLQIEQHLYGALLGIRSRLVRARPSGQLVLEVEEWRPDRSKPHRLPATAPRHPRLPARAPTVVDRSPRARDPGNARRQCEDRSGSAPRNSNQGHEVTDHHDAGLFAPNPPGPALPTATPQNPIATPRRFTDVHAFVGEYLAKVWARTIRDPDNSFRWCPRWYEHQIALDRLTALWRAHEALHAQDGTDAHTWWTDHADPTRKDLCAPDGPFTRCGPGRHQIPPDLPVTARRPASFTTTA